MEKLNLINGFMQVEPVYDAHPLFEMVHTKRGQKYQVIQKDRAIKEYEVGDTLLCTEYAGMLVEKKMYINLNDCFGRIRDGVYSGVFNHVVIKLDRLGDEYITKTGEKFIIPTKWEVHNTAPICGTVTGLPDMLHWGVGLNLMTWDCDMQLKIGDKVWVDPKSVIDALASIHDENIKLADPKMYTDDNSVYVFVKYSYIVVAKRDEEVIPLNGYCLIAPDEIKLSSDTIITVNNDKVYSTKRGTVRHIGTPNRQYIQDGLVDPDRFPKAPKNLGENIEYADLKIGDSVALKGNWAIRLESGFQNTFSDEVLYCVQFRGIDLIY